MPSSLDEFAEANPPSRTGYPSYLDALPDDVREQIRTSSAGHATVVKWLHGLGYDRATQQMVGNWRRKLGWKP
jgi:hypothetical protein